MDELRGMLEQFDGKRTAPLERLALRLAGDSDAIARLLSIAEEDPDSRIGVAATWVVLALHDENECPSTCATTAMRLGRLVERVAAWETRLHALQTLARIDLHRALSRSQRRTLGAIALQASEDPKPFIRAWSLHLLAMLGGGFDAALKRQAATRITAAEANEMASVRARLRNLRRSGALEWMTHQRS